MMAEAIHSDVASFHVLPYPRRTNLVMDAAALLEAVPRLTFRMLSVDSTGDTD